MLECGFCFKEAENVVPVKITRKGKEDKLINVDMPMCPKCEAMFRDKLANKPEVANMFAELGYSMPTLG
jgi:hypothetical protein